MVCGFLSTAAEVVCQSVIRVAAQVIDRRRRREHLRCDTVAQPACKVFMRISQDRRLDAESFGALKRVLESASSHVVRLVTRQMLCR